MRFMSSGAGRRADSVQIVGALLLAATVLFNPMLAFGGASGLPLNSGLVALAQGLIVASALLLGAADWRMPPYRWMALTLALIAFSALTGAIRAQFDAKSLGDVLLVPAFVMLGMRLHTRTLIATLAALQALILLVGLWEVIDPQQFGATFKVAEYYVRTRGFSEGAFWAGGDLFVSSERPQGRLLLAGSGIHRGSSLFLEPVSLGNWAVVVSIATAMFWAHLSKAARAGMIVSTFMLLIICDGRLSLTVCLILLAFFPIARHVPERWSVLYLPLCTLLLVAARHAGLLAETGDTFAGRLRYAADAFGRLDLAQLLAISSRRFGMEDAGLVYFVLRQSLFVAVALWLMLTLTSLGDDRAGRLCKHGIAVFIVLCLPISNALLSIKTAALMWTCYGYCYGRATRADARKSEPESSRATPVSLGTVAWNPAHG
jgi:putative polymerase